METFSENKIETLISGAWYDLSADVRTNPPPRVSGMGGMGFGITDRIGGAAVMTFTLDNSQANSAATLGYYTPGGTSSGGKLTPGNPVRWSFTYDGRKRFKFYGTIDTDGLSVTPGKYGTRDVSVRCSNWMAKAAKHKLDLLGYKTNKTFDQAARYILNNMYAQPQNTYFNTGQETFATVFDVTRTNTTSLGELNKLVFSEWGRAYIKGDDTNGETLVLEDNAWAGRVSVADRDNGSSIPVKQSAVTSKLLLMTGGADNLLLMTGATDDLLLNETQYASFAESDIEQMTWNYGDNVYNHVVFKTYPRDIRTSQILWSLPDGEPIELTAGQEITDMRGTYTDPNGGFAKVNALDDTMSTTYAAFQNSDGTGTDYTSSVSVTAVYGTAEVKYIIKNNAAVTVYITQLEATGSGVFIYDTNDKAFDDAASQNIYDFLPVEIDMPYLNNVTDLTFFGDESTIWYPGLLSFVSYPQPTITNLTMTVNKTSKQMMAFMFLEPRDFMKVNETVTDRSGIGDYSANAWTIQSYDFELINGNTIKWYVNLKYSGTA